jgi:hypothetical protein
MMKLLQVSDLRALVEHRHWPCISMYLPTHRMGLREIREDPIRLKNAIAEARDRLGDGGYSRRQADRLLEQASDLVVNQDFWLYQSDGLAVFVSPELFQYYRLPLRLHDEVDVSDHFSIRQLVPLFAGDGRFYILALSQKHVRFFEATRLGIRERAVPDMIKSIDDLRQYDQVEEHLQGHTIAMTKTGTRTDIVFHGQGNIADKATYKEDVIRYVRTISRTLEKYLNTDTCPLVLAGVEYEQSFYRQVSAYPGVLEKGIVGNPDELDENEMHRAAWALVEPYFAQARQISLSHYADLSDTDKTSDDAAVILPYACHGRVRALYMRTEARLWGKFDADVLAVEIRENPREGDIDLVELAAMYVLEHRGMIYALPDEEMPTGNAMAAMFRY